MSDNPFLKAQVVVMNEGGFDKLYAKYREKFKDIFEEMSQEFSLEANKHSFLEDNNYDRNGERLYAQLNSYHEKTDADIDDTVEAAFILFFLAMIDSFDVDVNGEG